MIQFWCQLAANVSRPRPATRIAALLLGWVIGCASLSVSAAVAATSASRCDIIGPLESGWEEGARVLKWSTSRELGVVGFDLLKRERTLDLWTSVNRALIAASNSPAGASYSLPLAADNASITSEWIVRVWTEDAQFADHAKDIVPFRATDAGSPRTRVVLAVPPVDEPSEARPGLMRPPLVGPLSRVHSVDVFTRSAGVHFLRFAELAAAFQVPVEELVWWADRGQLSLRQQGVRVPSWADGTSGGLYFHAPRIESLFFAGNVTQVSFDPVPLRMTVEVIPAGLATGSQAGQSLVTLERNLQSVPTLPGAAEDDFWVWDSFLGGHPSFGVRSYPFDLPGLVSTEGSARVEVEISSVSEVESTFSVLLNGRELGQRTWSGRVRQILRFDVEPAWLQPMTNTLRIVSGGDRISLGYLDRYRLDYPRRLQPTNGPILFSSGEMKVLEVAGPVGSTVEVWDVTAAARPIRLEHAEPSGGSETLRFWAMPAHEYVTFLRGSAIAPERLQAFGPDTLRDSRSRAEYLVIAPDSLVLAAAALAARRTSEGLSARVVSLSEIHHAFTHGVPTPTAVARFASHAHSTWAVPPRYLVLVGDGTYDYRGYLGQSDNLVPPLVISTLFGRIVTDERFGDLDGDGRPELAVGRLPVHNEAELIRLIGQMDDFGARLVRTPRALVLADRPDAGGQFIRNAEALGSILEPEFSVETILNEAMESPAVRDLMFQKLASGVQFFNYVGHGGRDRFGPGYLTISDVERLDFGTQQPLVVAMTCAAGQFGIPGTSCLAEALLLKSGRAPIAVWSPSGFSLDLQVHPLNHLLVEELSLQPFGTRIGDTLRRVITAFRDQGGDEITPALYSLLGDPAVPLNFGLRPATLSIRLVGDLVEVQLSGTPGATYQIMASERLDGQDWTVVEEVVVDASGEARFPVAVSAEPGLRFLRAEYRR